MKNVIVWFVVFANVIGFAVFTETNDIDFEALGVLVVLGVIYFLCSTWSHKLMTDRKTAWKTKLGPKLEFS